MADREVTVRLNILPPDPAAQKALAVIGEAADRSAAQAAKLNSTVAAVKPPPVPQLSAPPSQAALASQSAAATAKMAANMAAAKSAAAALFAGQVPPAAAANVAVPAVAAPAALSAVNPPVPARPGAAFAPAGAAKALAGVAPGTAAAVPALASLGSAAASAAGALTSLRSAALAGPRPAAAALGGIGLPARPGLPAVQPPAGGGGLAGVGSALNAAASGPVAALSAITPAAIGVAAAFKAVSLSNPGTIERLNLAFEDALATVGQRLAPAFEILTGVVRLVGDILMTILPAGADVRKALAPIGAALNEVREAIAPVAFFVKDVLLSGLKMFGEALNALLIPVKLLAQTMTAISSAIFGVSDQLETSVGAAARNITFTSQESFAKSVYAAAYKTGGAGEGDTVEEKVSGIAGTLKSIEGHTSSIAGILGIGSKDGEKNWLQKSAGFLTDLVMLPLKAPIKAWEAAGGLIDMAGGKDKEGEKKALEGIKPPDGKGGIKEALDGVKIPGAGGAGIGAGIGAGGIKEAGGQGFGWRQIVEAIEKLGGKVGDKGDKDEKGDWIRKQIDQGKRRGMQGFDGGS